MTRRSARLFFYIGTALSVLVFLVLTVDSHRQFPTLTNEADLTPSVVAGKNVWHAKNCVNCHTLLGEGAYYAPDLTKIAQLRGDAYLREFLKDPARFYSEERDGRLMPNPNLTDQQITDVIAFLAWVSRIDTQGWPPRPILVRGSAIPGANVGGAPPAPASDDPVALGQALFNSQTTGCAACHSVAPGVNLVGPSLAGIGTRAAERIKAPDYLGHATDAAGYIRESITDPNEYVLKGVTYSSNGRSLMPAQYGTTLSPQQLDQLVAYLMTLK
ncbi:MAG TPA: cytochrome c [Thermodesulfobacteriota bacterium]